MGGLLKKMIPKKVPVDTRRALAPYERDSALPTKDIAGDAEVLTKNGTLWKTKTSLFVSEKVGAAESEHEELVLFDEGICGAKTKADEMKAIKAIAFRGCNDTEFTGWYGLEG